jgi:Carboxypeptidase regulatory-like domain
MRTVALIVAIVAMGGCAEAARPEAPVSGIRGHVIAAPTCPVKIQGSPCPKETVETAVVVLTERGDRIATVSTNAEGSFSIDLSPGDYVLTARPPEGSTYVPRQTAVTVEPATYARVTLILDTRLREPLSE